MISDVFIRRPKLAMVISLVMMVAGIISIPKLPVAEYPEISPWKLSLTGLSTFFTIRQAAIKAGRIPARSHFNTELTLTLRK